MLSDNHLLRDLNTQHPATSKILRRKLKPKILDCIERNLKDEQISYYFVRVNRFNSFNSTCRLRAETKIDPLVAVLKIVLECRKVTIERNAFP